MLAKVETRNPIFSSFIVPHADNSEMQSQDSLEWDVAYLKDLIICESEGPMQLTPLNQLNIDVVADRFTEAWNNPKLRQGYLPTTPTKYMDIFALLKRWVIDPKLLVYIAQCEGLAYYDSFLRFEFSNSREKDGCSEVWLDYGLLHPEKSGKGFTKNPTRMALDFFQSHNQYLAVPIEKCVTSVSDRNAGSKHILETCGFIQDFSRPITQAPIVMGGNSIPMVRYFQ